MDWVAQLDSKVIAILIPIVGIVCGVGYAALKAHHAHLERMEKIRQGLDPDG